MKKILSFFAITLFLVQLSSGLCGLAHNYGIEPQDSTKAPYIPKVYKMNLDLPPKEMWREFITDNQAGINDFIKNVLGLFKIPAFFTNLFDNLAEKYHDQQFIAEVKAISELANAEFLDAFILNFVYDITAFCTSTVVNNEAGQIFHGRNLDFLLGEYIGPLSGIGEWYKNGTKIFTSLMIAGLAGTHTGMRDNGFTLSCDSRYTTNLFADLYRIAFSKTDQNVLYTMRQALEQASDYSSASNFLNAASLDAPVYLIMSGTKQNEGQIIEKNPTGPSKAYTLNIPSTWYQLVTNYELDKPDPFYDFRRQPALEKVNNLGYADITIDNLFGTVMTKFPTNNKHTILTCMMSAQMGYFNTTVWQ